MLVPDSSAMQASGRAQASGRGEALGASWSLTRQSHQDFREYEVYSTSHTCFVLLTSHKLLNLTPFCLCLIPGVVPLEDLPVLTKAGVSCSLAEYRRRLGRQEAPRHDVAPTDLVVPCVDVPPPPYVESLKEDPFARNKDFQTQKEDVTPSRSPGYSREQSGDHRGGLLLYSDQPPY